MNRKESNNTRRLCTALAAIIVISIFTVGIVPVSAAPIVERSINPDIVSPDETVDVSIEFTTTDENLFLELRDGIPTGWTVTDISANVEPEMSGFDATTGEVYFVWVGFPITSGTYIKAEYTLHVPAGEDPDVYILEGTLHRLAVPHDVTITGEDTIEVKLPYDVDLTVDDSTKTTDADVNATYSLTVENTGANEDTYDLSITIPGGADLEALSETQVTVPGGESEVVELNVASFLAGDYVTTVEASSAHANDDVTVTTTVRAFYGVGLEVTPEERTVVPDEDAVYTLMVTNSGNDADTIGLSIISNEADFGALSEATFTLSVGASDTADLTVRDSNVGSYETTVRATSQNDDTKWVTKTVTTNVTEVEDTTPPYISNVGSSDITTTTATITWATDEDSDSLVKYGTTQGGPYAEEEYNAADVTDHSIGLTGLVADTTYFYVVNSTDPSDNSAQSGENSFTTLETPDTTPPVISNVASSSITTNSATITWDTDEPSDSLVKYGTTSGVYTDEESDAADVTSHSIGLAGLAAGTTYYYVVNSTDPSDNSAESAEYSFTTEAEEKPDLIVTGITPNCDYLFANESNSINATIKNNGTADAGAFNVSFDVDGFSEEVRVISGLAMGASEEVTVMDATLRNAGESVTINVTADCDAEVGESNEANNAMNISKTVVNNGYKGKRYTGGEDIATLQTHTLNGSVLYSVGDSYYLSGSTNPWYTYTANWTASDLPVPGEASEASIEKARLYVMYTWDKVQGMPDNVSLKFNDNLTTRDAFYTDRKGYDGYDYPYGMLAYDVTGDFNTGSINTAVLENLNPVAGNPSIRGMLLVVIYADDSEPQRTIIMNEGFDLLYGGSGKCTTPEEATAFAPFAGAIEDIDNKSARLITVAPGADPNEGELIFNGHTWTDVWNFAGNSEIGIDDRDVTTYLLAENNEAAFQSSGDYMEASNAILVVEEKVTGSIIGKITYTFNETGIAGVIVNLTKEGTVEDTTVTNGTGYYNFTEVIPGDYYVNASKPKVEGVTGFWDNSTEVTVSADAITTANMMLWLKGDLNNNGMSADAGDLTLMKRASVGEITGDWRYDLNKNEMIADAGDLTLMKRASVGEIVLEDC